MSTVDGLVVWLRAQLDDVEFSDWHERACQTHQKMPPGSPLGLAGSALSCNCRVPEFVLRDVEAKRAILDNIPMCHACGTGRRCIPHDVSFGEPSTRPAHPVDEQLIRLLALPYSDRPGYLDKWRP